MILLECGGCNRVMHLPDSEGEFLDRDEPRCPSCRKKQAEGELKAALGPFVEVPKDRGPVATSLLIFVAGMIAVIIAMLSGCDGKPTIMGTCLQHGYPRADFADGVVYCKRQVLGTDEIVPLKQLRARDNREQMARSYEKAFGQAGAK